MPTVAPKIPRETSVRSGAEPSSGFILSLACDQYRRVENVALGVQFDYLPPTDCVNVNAESDEHALSHVCGLGEQ
jgi:hypothetical protein